MTCLISSARLMLSVVQTSVVYIGFHQVNHLHNESINYVFMLKRFKKIKRIYVRFHKTRAYEFGFMQTNRKPREKIKYFNLDGRSALQKHGSESFLYSHEYTSNSVHYTNKTRVGG